MQNPIIPVHFGENIHAYLFYRGKNEPSDLDSSRIHSVYIGHVDTSHIKELIKKRYNANRIGMVEYSGNRARKGDDNSNSFIVGNVFVAINPNVKRTSHNPYEISLVSADLPSLEALVDSLDLRKYVDAD